MFQRLIQEVEGQLVSGLIGVCRTCAKVKCCLDFAAIVGVIYKLRSVPVPTPNGSSCDRVRLHSDSSSRQAEDDLRGVAVTRIAVSCQVLQAISGEIFRWRQ